MPIDPMTGYLLSNALPYIVQMFGGGSQKVNPQMPWETPVGSDILNRIMSYQPKAYGGQLGVPITGKEQDLVAALGQGADYGFLREPIMSTIRGDYLRPENQPYLNAMSGQVKNLSQELLGQGMDAISGQFRQGGAASGSAELTARQKALSKTTGAATDTLARVFAEIFNQERNRQTAFLPYGFKLAEAPMTNAILGLQGQQYLRNALMGNQKMGYEDFARQEQQRLAIMSSLGNILGMKGDYQQYAPPDWYTSVKGLTDLASKYFGYQAGVTDLTGMFGSTGSGTPGTPLPTQYAGAAA